MRNILRILSVLLLTSLSLAGCAQTATQYPSPTASSADRAQAELEQMLAPIALYPDTVLTHVLIASTYPLEVVQADRWVKRHSDLDAQEAVEAAEPEGWDPSVTALVAFPELLDRLNKDLDWTQRLGEAFLADEDAVMAAIQKLRNQAYVQGNLNDNEQVRVVREEKVIYIEPAAERVVYVPWYDTRVVYGSWWWPRYPPVVWYYPPRPRYVAPIYWGPRVVVGPTFFYSGIHWQQRQVLVINNYSYGPVYSSRSAVRYQGARQWHHNPVHRRNVHYHSPTVRAKYRNASAPPAHYRTSSPSRTTYSRRTDQPERVQQRPRNTYSTDRTQLNRTRPEADATKNRLRQTYLERSQNSTQRRSSTDNAPRPTRSERYQTPPSRSSEKREAKPDTFSRQRFERPPQQRSQSTTRSDRRSPGSGSRSQSRPTRSVPDSARERGYR